MGFGVPDVPQQYGHKGKQQANLNKHNLGLVLIMFEMYQYYILMLGTDPFFGEEREEKVVYS